MPRTWSNIKYTETRSAAQRAKDQPSRLTLFLALMALCVIFFLSVLAVSLNTVLRHPITEIPNLAHPPKDK